MRRGFCLPLPLGAAGASGPFARAAEGTPRLVIFDPSRFASASPSQVGVPV
jgi:hypothetical protein